MSVLPTIISVDSNCMVSPTPRFLNEQEKGKHTQLFCFFNLSSSYLHSCNIQIFKWDYCITLQACDKLVLSYHRSFSNVYKISVMGYYSTFFSEYFLLLVRWTIFSFGWSHLFMGCLVAWGFDKKELFLRNLTILTGENN